MSPSTTTRATSGGLTLRSALVLAAAGSEFPTAYHPTEQHLEHARTHPQPRDHRACAAAMSLFPAPAISSGLRLRHERL
jgi:hypothetical protein